MEQAVIFKPFLATMVLTLVVWIYMYLRRLSFIFANDLDARKMTPGELARVSPPSVSTPSDNLKNLLELPTVFYAVVLYLFATRQVDAVYLDLAWGFVALRILHESRHGIEPHRLIVDQRGEEHRGLMRFEPQRRIRDQRERNRV